MSETTIERESGSMPEMTGPDERARAEDVLTLPDGWRRFLHPRRGGTPLAVTRPGAAAVRAAGKLLEPAGAVVERLLAGGTGDPALAEAARRHLDGTADPAGAAVLAASATVGTWGKKVDATRRAFADAWAAEHGVAFAACAVLERARTKIVQARDAATGAPLTGAAHRDDYGGVDEGTLRRVRALLASADDAEYAAAEDRLADHRRDPTARWFVSYLVPTRRDWLAECGAGDSDLTREHRWLRLCAMDDAAQLGDPPLVLSWTEKTRGVLATLVDGIGAGALPLLALNFDRSRDPKERRLIAEMIAVLPTDEAFQALLDRAGDKQARAVLAEAAARFPRRAVRLLARAAADEAPAAPVKALLTTHVQAHADAFADVLPGLPVEARAAAEAIAASSVRVPDAPAEAVPAILAGPPWRNPRRPVLKDVEPPPARIVWRDGQREEWLGSDVSSIPPPAAPDYADLAGRIGGLGPDESLALIVHGPEDAVRPALAKWETDTRWNSHLWMQLLTARYGFDALPPVKRMAKRHTRHGDSLEVFLTADVALLMADWLSRGPTAHVARRWFARHGVDAAPYLVPAALGTAAKPRRVAEQALRHLRDRLDGDPGGALPDAVRAAVGDRAADAVAGLLAAHPAETGLVQPPKIAAWADPAALPQVVLRGGPGDGRALPPDAVRALIELVALPSAFGMDEVKAACEPGAVAEFGWALFERWREDGSPSKDGWALVQLGRTGDDETVRRLTPVIRAWPGEGGHKYAVTGLEALQEIGSDVALMHLHGIAQRVKFKGLQAEAQAGINAVARRLGLGPEQLADRLVPTFGLAADGSMTLDYGPRRFTVGFDEQLKPVISDEDGKVRKSLPKPGAKDDPELAPAAYKAFGDLKKDVRTAAAGQIRRLEEAMVAGRRWTPGEFRQFIVDHPLVWHLARRLVWLAEDGDKATSFRIAEDRTFADVEDDPYTPPEQARIGIAHPIHLGDAVQAWAEVFADYEILQPFPQLGRAVHTLTEDERAGDRLTRFEGVKVPFGKVLGLVRRGWDRGEPQGGGNEMWISRFIAPRRYVVVELDPGLPAVEVSANGDYQTLRHVWFAEKPTEFHWRDKETALRFAELDPVTASEILADLAAVAAAAVR